MATKSATPTNKPITQMLDETADEYCERFRRGTRPDMLDNDVTTRELVTGLLLPEVQSSARHRMNEPHSFVQLARHIRDINSRQATPPGASPTAPPTAAPTAPRLALRLLLRLLPQLVLRLLPQLLLAPPTAPPTAPLPQPKATEEGKSALHATSPAPCSTLVVERGSFFEVS